MPSKKKKYNARFPAGRIKKIMQTDEEVGKVAQAVPIIISRTLELFVESLLTKAMQITSTRNAKTLTPSHMKQCILSENRFDFLKDLVKMLPDSATSEEDGAGERSVPASSEKKRNHETKSSNSRRQSVEQQNFHENNSVPNASISSNLYAINTDHKRSALSEQYNTLESTYVGNKAQTSGSSCSHDSQKTGSIGYQCTTENFDINSGCRGISESSITDEKEDETIGPAQILMPLYGKPDSLSIDEDYDT